MAGRFPSLLAPVITGALVGWPGTRPAAAAAPTVAVLLGGFNQASHLVITGGAGPTGPWELTVATHGIAIRYGSGPVRYQERLLVRPRQGTVTVRAGTTARTWAGPLDIRTHDGHLRIVAHMPEDRYLAGIVAGEMTPAAPLEALRAQAIVARSYLYQSRDRHRAEGAWVCDQSHCQVWHQPVAATAAAVAATAGLVVLGPGGRPVPVYYHAACGGSTVAADLVFGGRPQPHLHGGPDTVCCRSASWEASVPVGEVVTALQRAHLLGVQPVSAMEVADQTADGWPVSLRADGVGSKTISAYQAWLAFGRAWGWGRVPGLHFTLALHGGTVTFRGRGLGHGIGLCQRGCRIRATGGQRAEAILAAYFPGTTVGRR